MLFATSGELRDRGVAIIYITHRLDEVHRGRRPRRRCCATGTWRSSATTADFDRRGARLGHDRPRGRRRRAPGAPDWELGDEPAIEFRAAAPRGAFETSRSPSTRARSSRSTASSARDPPSSPSRCSASRKLDGGRARGRRPRRVARRARPRRSGRRRLRAGGPQGGRRSSPCARSRENIAVPSWRRLVARPRLHPAAGRGREPTGAGTRSCSIRSRNDPMQPIGTLSGGNQQKVRARPLARTRHPRPRAWSSRRAASTSAPARRSTGRCARSRANGDRDPDRRRPTTRRSSRSPTARSSWRGAASSRELERRRDHHRPAAGRGRRLSW